MVDKYTVKRAFGLATGDTGSNTTAVVVAMVILPALSVTVKVIVLIPKSAQVMLLGDMLTEAIPQLSVAPPLNKLAAIGILPDALMYNTLPEIGLMLGLMVSNTVMVAVPVCTLLFTSVTVKVTVLAPIFAHVKLV